MVESPGDGFEAVYVELDWYDGPRAGLADVHGVPHYFRAVNDYSRPGEPDDEYVVWPASRPALDAEREQWRIFVAWNTRHKDGCASAASHPGNGGIDARYDELTAFLEPHRVTPQDARPLAAEWRPDPPPGYRADGPSYRARWRPI